jgi:quercetin dioxygenase-like cupin family protein|tara:strand:- start:159 stop:551 length:393 start_codon:yes stop_codon:yes gene_type:complete
MKIFDNNSNLLAIIIREEEIHDGKNFFTENQSEFQIASFSLDGQTTIERHHHPNQNRKITGTSEVLIVIKGKMEFEIYDKNLELVTTEIIGSGEAVALISGGHGIKILEDTKFFEVKQGPYIEKIDKKRF